MNAIYLIGGVLIGSGIAMTATQSENWVLGTVLGAAMVAIAVLVEVVNEGERK